MSPLKSPRPNDKKDAEPSIPSGEQVLNIDEVADWLRIPKSTLYKLCSDGEIPAAKIGKHWRFNQGLVVDWIKAKSTRGKTEKE